MRAATIRALVLATTFLSGPALAQEINPQGADALKQDFAKYLGQTAVDRGILRVEPAGDSYRVTIDLQKAAMAMAPADAKASVTVDPFVLNAAPAAGGTWTVKIASYPRFSMRQEKDGDEQSLDFSVDGYSFEGTFDPALAAFTKGADRMSGIRLVSKTKDETVDAAYGASSSTITSAAAGPGTVTGEWAFKSVGLKETIEGRGEAPMRVVVDTGEIGMSWTVAEGRGPAILDIVAFFAANPEKTKIVAAQDDLRARLTKALPLWGSSGGAVSAKDVSVATPLGTFKAASFGQTASISGMSQDGSYTMSFKFSGFSAPEGVLPGWIGPLFPKDLDIAATLSGVDLDRVARLAIDKFDLSKEEPLSSEVQQQILGILAAGNLKITVPPARVASESLVLNIEGNGTVMPAPSGTATVTAEGLDKTLAALAGASGDDPNRQQAMMALGVAKNLAKPVADGKSQWQIEAAANGSVSVNGQMIVPPSR